MARYRKKPVIVEAFQWTPGHTQAEIPEWVVQVIREKRVTVDHNLSDPPQLVMKIQTIEGEMRANPGDYIIKGVAGELYPCKREIFRLTYEEVDE